MSIFRKKYRTTLASEVNDYRLNSEIMELEIARENINDEIETLLREYKKLTGKRKAVRGAKKIGKSKKDYSYWHKDLI